MMKKDTKTVMNKKKLKGKKQQKKNLTVSLLELTLMKKILIWILKLVKYAITLINHL